MTTRTEHQIPGRHSSTESQLDITLRTAQEYGNRVVQRGQGLVDTLFPPKQREALLSKLHAFAMAHPRLSAFLAIQVLFTGIPLAIFALYSLSVFISSLVVALIFALFVAVTFTACAVGIALLVVLPTVLFTTAAATAVFLWALGAYYVYRWASSGRPTEETSHSAKENGFLKGSSQDTKFGTPQSNGNHSESLNGVIKTNGLNSPTAATK